MKQFSPATNATTASVGLPRVASTAPLPPLLANGRYRVSTLLGEGGMSAVYEAYDTLLERPVAIKILRAAQGTACPERDTRGLAREACVLAAVHHPNVVAVFALHQEETPPFLVMERVDGVSLDFAHPAGDDALRESLELLRQIANGLDAIHAVGLVHGDVKPSNVLVSATGRVKIVDVGLVPMLERMEWGDILGTPAYISPERALGTVARRVLAARSDVYSFAVVAFELLTGVRPFSDEQSIALLNAHATRAPPLASAVSRLASVFDAPFTRALAKSPEQRPASAGELMDALERAALGVDLSGATLRVLFVDDDDDTRSLMSTMVESRLYGATVEMAGDGAEAIAAVQRRVPSVGVFDLGMPGVAGVELVAAIRLLAPGLPLIVCSGAASESDWRELLALGVRKFMLKPVDADDLCLTIRHVLDPPRHVRG